MAVAEVLARVMIGLLEQFVGGEQLERRHLEQQLMKEELFGRRPPTRICLEAQVDEVSLPLVERVNRLSNELGRHRMRVAVAAQLQVEHL